MNVVFKVNDEIKNKMIQYYADKKKDKEIPYVVFQAVDQDTVITLYTSNKVMFQGVSADVDATMWKEMMGITDRTAQFVCVIALYFPDGKYYLSRGICKGEIVNTPKGKNGFGYDPCFYLKAYHKTMAELPMAEKNKISHRAKALNQLKELVYENFSDK